MHRLRCIISRSPLLQRREPCPMRRIVDRAANSRKRSVRTNQSQVFISYSRNDISEGRSMTATAVAEFVNVVGRARHQFTVALPRQIGSRIIRLRLRMTVPDNLKGEPFFRTSSRPASRDIASRPPRCSALHHERRRAALQALCGREQSVASVRPCDRRAPFRIAS